MIKVIIVEDDPMVREINSKFLLKIGGFEIVGEASNLNEAKEIIIKKEAELLLLDIFLPDGKGLDLLKWIRNEGFLIDTLLITADKCRDSVDEAFKYGAIDYLIKPFKYERIKEALLRYQERIEKINKIELFEQDIIDQYLINNSISNEESKETIDLAKGLSLLTYKKIAEYMEKNDKIKLTAEEIANGSGLARVTARRYLENMTENGRVERIQEYGRIGRPTNYYILKR